MLSLLVLILLVIYSKSKGYSPLAWALTGLIGYAVLSFLPDTTPFFGRERKDAEENRRKGNRIGYVISGISITLDAAILIWLFNV